MGPKRGLQEPFQWATEGPESLPARITDRSKLDKHIQLISTQVDKINAVDSTSS